MTDVPAGVVIAFSALLGLVLGSFLNVCISRWGAEPKQSVVRPRSRCPRCGAALHARDNIPVISWLLLRGKCRSCGLPISPMYPLIELATAVIWAGMVWRYGPTSIALLHAVFVTILLGVAVTDLRRFIIPDEFTLGGILLLVVLGLARDERSLQVAASGAGFGAGLIFTVGLLGKAAFRREAMGGGDVKLMGLIGLVMGVAGTMATLLAGAVVSLLLSGIAWVIRARGVPTSSDLTNDDAESTADGPRIGSAVVWGLVLCVPIFWLMYAGLLPKALAVATGMMVWLGLAVLALAIVSWRLPKLDVAPRWLAVPAAFGAARAVADLKLGLIVAGGVLVLVAVWESARSNVSSSSPDADDSMDMSNEELRASGYIPFGVGLSIAAALLLELDAVDRIRAWAQF